MRRITTLLLTLIPGLAAADSRLDLQPIPDLMVLEPVYHLDRGTSWRSAWGIAASIGIGWGSHGDEKGLVGEGSLQIGKRMKQLAVGATSELVAGGNDLVRGRHTGWLELRSDDHRGDDDINGVVTINTAVEHGEARALAPIYLGPGRRNHAAASADILIGLEGDPDDMMLAALVQTDGSVTHWLDAPLLDRAYRGAFGLGLSFAPNDGEIPRGRIDAIRVRVEHANIERTIRAAGTPMHDSQVRTIEIMSGLHEFTGWIDHEMLFAVTAQFGVVWIESDATAGQIEDTFFKMELGAHLKWRQSRTSRRELGIAWAREPGPTPDGQNHASDWRLEMVTGAEDSHFVLAARGGVSWMTHISGGATNPNTVKRYGSHVEGFAKLGLGLELGAYNTMSFEPRVAGDPWSTPREFSTEVGVLARWRPSTY